MPVGESKGDWELDKNLEKFCDGCLENSQWQECRMIRNVE